METLPSLKPPLFNAKNFWAYKYILYGRDGADNKKCIRMLHCVRKLCPHAAPHRIQTQLSSRCTAPHRKLNIF